MRNAIYHDDSPTMCISKVGVDLRGIIISLLVERRASNSLLASSLLFSAHMRFIPSVFSPHALTHAPIMSPCITKGKH